MKRTILSIIAAITLLGLNSCSDFFDQESDHVIYTENHKLDNSIDSIYSMTGILMKLQSLADRTILLGELRGDLSDLTSVANSDLRDIATFNVGDDNAYNSPRDYYAVINNCNYFIENVDTTLKNNRNEYIFMREYAAVKAIRAWTYMQLAMNYGSVPFVTTPILTKEESERDYPRYDMAAICEYFINDLLPLADRYGREYPRYGTIRNTDSRFFYFPLNIVLGDLYLWHGSATGNTDSYKQSALRYYKYINERNGDNSSYPTQTDRVYWSIGSASWTSPLNSYSYRQNFTSERYTNNAELITMIPCDSIPSEGNYSQLPNLFLSRMDNNYKSSIIPSTRIQEISEAQEYCQLGMNGTTVSYSPKGMTERKSGDLRLYSVWNEGLARDLSTGDLIETMDIAKYSGSVRNVHIYRRQMVYFRMAEALNAAGYPRMAFAILSTGLNNSIVDTDVMPYIENDADSLYLRQFDFPTSRYVVMGVEELLGQGAFNYNTMGMHSRGSGFTPMNEFYQLPYDTLRTEAEQLPDLKAYVEEKLLTEEALEFAFEGVRYYDLMRFAMRQANPGQFLAEKILERRGAANKDAMRGEIKTDLTNQQNWYLRWNGAIGFFQ